MAALLLEKMRGVKLPLTLFNSLVAWKCWIWRVQSRYFCRRTSVGLLPPCYLEHCNMQSAYVAVTLKVSCDSIVPLYIIHFRLKAENHVLQLHQLVTNRSSKQFSFRMERRRASMKHLKQIVLKGYQKRVQEWSCNMVGTLTQILTHASIRKIHRKVISLNLDLYEGNTQIF